MQEGELMTGVGEGSWHPHCMYWDPPSVGSRLGFSTLPGIVLGTLHTALFSAWNARGHGCSWNCRSWRMCFSRLWEPPVSGSAMETHIPSLDLETQAGNFQLSAAVPSDPLPRSFQSHEKLVVTLTGDFVTSLWCWAGSRGSFWVMCGHRFLIGVPEKSPLQVCVRLGAYGLALEGF